MGTNGPFFLNDHMSKASGSTKLINSMWRQSKGKYRNVMVKTLYPFLHCSFFKLLYNEMRSVKYSYVEKSQG